MLIPNWDTPGEDYEEFVNEGVYYSLNGIYKLSKALHQSLKAKNRQEWCQEVGDVLKPQVDSIVKQIIERDKRIQLVKDRVKSQRDKKTCQVTKQRQVPAATFKLAVHHLYSVNQYPHLADVEHNLITLTNDVHDQFHDQFMGGKNKSCTIDDFMNFIHHYYSENSEIIIWLQAQKLKLGEQLPLGKQQPHVLYLPSSKVQ
jgi:hypothetical protein